MQSGPQDNPAMRHTSVRLSQQPKCEMLASECPKLTCTTAPQDPLIPTALHQLWRTKSVQTIADTHNVGHTESMHNDRMRSQKLTACSTGCQIKLSLLALPSSVESGAPPNIAFSRTPAKHSRAQPGAMEEAHMAGHPCAQCTSSLICTNCRSASAPAPADRP